MAEQQAEIFAHAGVDMRRNILIAQYALPAFDDGRFDPAGTEHPSHLIGIDEVGITKDARALIEIFFYDLAVQTHLLAEFIR